MDMIVCLIARLSAYLSAYVSVCHFDLLKGNLSSHM